MPWAKRGIPVFPVGVKNKKPLTGKGGYKNATTDAKRIREWGKKHPSARVGINLEAAGLLVVDTDPRNGGDESLDALTQTHGFLPVTWCARTPGGGTHHYFKNPRGIGGTELADGIDIKAIGGYVIVPESKGYEWHARPDRFELAELPAWIHERLTSRNGDGPNDRESKPGLAALLGDPAGEGTRNEWLTVVAGHYARHFDRRRDYEHHVLAAAALTDPPLDEHEALTVAVSVWGRESGKFESDVDREVHRRLVRQEAERRLRSEAGEGSDLTIRALADAQLAAAETVEWVIPGLLAMGEKAVIAGPPKSLKTWFALHLARAIAVGDRVLDEDEWQVGQPQCVLFVQEEGAHQRWAQRLMDVFGGSTEAPFSYAHRAGLSLLNRDHVERVIEEAKQIEARAIFLDPLQRITPGVNENDATEIGPAWDAIHEIAHATGAAVVVLHHARKGGGEPTMDSIRGSSRVAGEVDLMFIMRRVERGTLEVYLDGRELVRPDAEQGNLEVRYDTEAPHRMRIAGVRLNVKGPTNSTRPAVEQVLRDAGEALTTAEVHKRVEKKLGRSRDRSGISRELTALVEDGQVAKTAPGRGKASRWEWAA